MSSMTLLLFSPRSWTVQKHSTKLASLRIIQGTPLSVYIRRSLQLLRRVSISTRSAYTKSTQSSLFTSKISRFYHRFFSCKPRHHAFLYRDILIPPITSRWIRLLFSREFPFDQMLILWDTLFSIDPTFKLIGLICTSMLLRIRWDCKTHMSRNNSVKRILMD